MQIKCTADSYTMPTRKRRQQRKPIDGRTRLARRIRELSTSYLVALGGRVSRELRDRCERAAQLVVISEDARRKAVTGSIDLDALVRIENTAQRALDRLGLDRKPEPSDGASDLDRYLESRATENEATT
jgi:hypothetical protein